MGIGGKTAAKNNENINGHCTLAISWHDFSHEKKKEERERKGERKHGHTKHYLQCLFVVVVDKMTREGAHHLISTIK